MERVLYIVMAGGRGERLKPLTDDYPKPLVRFGPSGRIIDFTLYNCLCSGGGDVVVLTQYLSGMLEAYLARRWRRPFSEAGKSLETLSGDKSLKGRFLGTADAVYQALALRSDLPDVIVVLAGDHVYRMDYQPMIRFHQSRGRAATVGAVRCSRRDSSRFGIIQAAANRRVKRFFEKPASLDKIVPRGRDPLASMGIYVFSARPLLDWLEKNQEESPHDFGGDVIPRMAESGEVFAYPFVRADGRTGYWRDVGDVFSYWKSHLDLLSGQGGELYLEPVPGLMRSPLSPVSLIRHYERGSMRIDNCLISETARVDGCVLENSVIGPEVRISEGAVVRNSVLMDGATVEKWARLQSAIVEPQSLVEHGTGSRYCLIQEPELNSMVVGMY